MIARLALLLVLTTIPTLSSAWPIDGYAETGIRRLEGERLINEGIISGRQQPAGGRLTTGQVDLRLLDYKDMELPEPDPAFNRQLVKLLAAMPGATGSRFLISVIRTSRAMPNTVATTGRTSAVSASCWWRWVCSRRWPMPGRMISRSAQRFCKTPG